MESFRERNYDFTDFKFDDDRNIEYEQFRELRKMIRDTDFSTFKRPHTWTFTFKYDQSIQSAKKKMRHFLNVLNKQVYGNASQRFNKRLKCIPILEKDDNTRIHYHLILEHLSQRNMRPETYFMIMQKLWKFGRVETEGLFINDDESKTGWLNYITKSETKFDKKQSKDFFIDVENMTL